MKKQVKKQGTYPVQEEAKLNVVNEPVAEYNSSYERAMTDSFAMMEEVRRGVTKSKLLQLAEKMDISVAELADILHISLRTIQRYDENDRLDPHISEHIMLLDRLYRKGQTDSIFRTPQGFNNWMKREQFGFNFNIPIKLIDTYSGIEAVSDLLTQFEHGIFA